MKGQLNNKALSLNQPTGNSGFGALILTTIDTTYDFHNLQFAINDVFLLASFFRPMLFGFP